jgi:hypothetical protein
MLVRVAVGQVRFNLPGLATDARGVVAGRQLVARFAAIDRLVAFLRVLSAEQSLDDLQPGLRIVYARGGAGTREAIVVMPIVSPALADVVAHAARLAGGQTFTGVGKHFVQYRDARAPLGYDIAGLSDMTGDLVLYGTEQIVPYRFESELPLAKLLFRLSLVAAGAQQRGWGSGNGLGDGPLFITARRGLGPVLAGYLHRAIVGARAPGAEGGLRASAAMCETAAASAFGAPPSFWLFRVERLPARMRGLVTRTPGLDVFVPVTDNAAVAAGYRHPIHLESCRGSFPADRLYLFSPRGVTEVVPLPALAAIEDVVRIRMPASDLQPGRAAPTTRPDLVTPLRLEAGGRPPGPTVAALIPWNRLPWLRRVTYALPAPALTACTVALLERGVLVRGGDALQGIPFGTLYELAGPDVLIPVGTRLRPALSPQLLSERLGASQGTIVIFPGVGEQPLRVAREALVPLEPQLLARVVPPTASVVTPGEQPAASAPVEIENRPLGPMPLWGLERPVR